MSETMTWALLALAFFGFYVISLLVTVCVAAFVFSRKTPFQPKVAPRVPQKYVDPKQAEEMLIMASMVNPQFNRQINNGDGKGFTPPAKGKK